jgi:hypothetical protein
MAMTASQLETQLDFLLFTCRIQLILCTNYLPFQHKKEKE